MKRKAFLKTYATRIALTMLMLCLIVYTVYHAIGNSSAGLLTVAAREITDSRYLEGEGYVFRSETVLQAEQAGLVDPLAENGTKVGKGATLAWNGHAVTNNKEASRHVAKEYRSGWNPFA